MLLIRSLFAAVMDALVVETRCDSCEQSWLSRQIYWQSLENMSAEVTFSLNLLVVAGKCELVGTMAGRDSLVHFLAEFTFRVYSIGTPTSPKVAKVQLACLLAKVVSDVILNSWEAFLSPFSHQLLVHSSYASKKIGVQYAFSFNEGGVAAAWTLFRNHPSISEICTQDYDYVHQWGSCYLRSLCQKSWWRRGAHGRYYSCAYFKSIYVELKVFFALPSCSYSTSV